MMLKSHVGRKTRWLAGCSSLLVAGAMSTAANAQATTDAIAQEQAQSETLEEPGTSSLPARASTGPDMSLPPRCCA